METARGAGGSGAGCDVWSGTELSVAPSKACETFLTLVRRWDAKRSWLQGWHHLRQVHLRKEPGLGPIPPSSLRPIAILSIWYSTLMSSLLRRNSMRAWLVSTVPDSCHGGIRGRSVTTAVTSLLPQLENASPALALDYRKCFDMLDPRLVLAVLTLHRWPTGLLKLLQHVWQDQHRWLEMRHLSAGQPVHVISSMPQVTRSRPWV